MVHVLKAHFAATSPSLYSKFNFRLRLEEAMKTTLASHPMNILVPTWSLSRRTH